MNTTGSAVLQSLQVLAASQAAPHAQYNHPYFAAFDTLMRVRRDVHTKMGKAFAKNEIVMVRSVSDDPDQNPKFVTAWSTRNGIATSIPRSALAAV